MAHKIAVFNKKGGVGKSVISVNLAATLASFKNEDGSPRYRVLLLDFDPQENASEYLGVGTSFRSEADQYRNLGLVLKGQQIDEGEGPRPAGLSDVMYPFTLREYVSANSKEQGLHSYQQLSGDLDDAGKPVFISRRYKPVVMENFKIVPAYSQIGEIFENDNYEDEDILKASLDVDEFISKIKEIEDQFDFILFDCPPALDRFSKIALFCSGLIVIPLKPGLFETSGLMRVTGQLEVIQKLFGRRPELVFAVMNMTRGLKLHKAFYNMNAEALNKLIAKTCIPLVEDVNRSLNDLVPFAFAPEKEKEKVVRDEKGEIKSVHMAKIFEGLVGELFERMESIELEREG